jgi:hypothetical protein
VLATVCGVTPCNWAISESDLPAALHNTVWARRMTRALCRPLLTIASSSARSASLSLTRSSCHCGVPPQFSRRIPHSWI